MTKDISKNILSGKTFIVTLKNECEKLINSH